MLTSDLIMDVRASRTISTEQVELLEKTIFAAGAPTRDQLDLLYQIGRYVLRADPCWGALLKRAAQEAAAAADEAHAPAAHGLMSAA